MRWRWRVALFILLLPPLTAAAFYLWLLSSLPQTSGRLALLGVAAAVTVTRDAEGIPHITAESDRDAAFALGFLHAQDRLFQMELLRRVVSGRLAELFGPGALPSDRVMRTLGLYRAAERQYALLSPALREALDAYAAGVNAFLAQRRALPPEYYLINARPEPWRPADTLAWGKYMALRLSGNFRSELLHARLAARLTPSQVAQLFPAYPGDAPTTVGDLAALYRTLPLDRLYTALPPWIGPNFASNNWVVDAAHTQSGKPLLANDPHLGFDTPGVWYLSRVDTPERHLAGATAPGTPFVVIGHNDRIGWGFTTTEGDVEDVFVEHLDPDDAGRYLTPQGSEPFLTRSEEIRVLGQAPVSLAIRTTRHGPVISDLGGPAEGLAPQDHVLALQATFLAEDDVTPQAIFDLGHAGNWAEFNAALESFTAPQQNIVYADIDGNIGFTAPARIPIRGKGDGWMPVPGWTGEYDWTGFIPFAELPRVLNPPAGRLVSANNKIVPEGYPYFIARDWDVPNRAERINALLDVTPQQSPDESAAIQADTFSTMSRQVLPLMLRIKPDEPRLAAALDKLRQWDGRMEMDRPEPLIFTAWLRALNKTLFAERLGDAFRDYWSLRPLVIRGILADHPEWCVDPARPGTNDCAAPLAASLRAALDELTQAYGGDMSAWRWGAAHVASFPHPVFSRVAMLRDMLATEIAAPGGSDTVNRGEMVIGADQPYLDRHGAGLRMILDFSDLDAARFMIVPGQSGNPLSPHYRDLLRSWRDFRWLRLGPEASGATLTLAPSP